MSNFKYLLVAAGLVFVGACSDSYDPTPSASGVFPAEGFAGRHVRVEVSGEETQWADGATVSFGDGITVSNVVVASESAIFADLDIAPTAALSDHDVTVTSGKETDTLTAAFKVESPIELTFGQGAQGSITQFTVTNRDFDTPFDATFTGDGVLTQKVFTNIAVDAGPGVTLLINNASEYTVTGFALIDVDAPAMTSAVSVVSGPVGGTQVTSQGAPVAITARTPMALMDTPATGSIAMPFDSGLYEVTAATPPVLAQLSLSLSGSNGQPALAILPESGHFADLLAADATSTSQVVHSKIYVVVYDLSGASGYSYEVDNTAISVNAADDTESGNNTSAGATQLTATATTPALIDNASLTLTDEDWFKITVPVGKVIHVQTMAGDPQTDTFVDIYGPDDDATLFAEGDDLDYHEDVVSDPTTAAGTYYIQITASQAGFFDPSQSHYIALVTLEDP